jgi:hypothetical protein
MFPPSSRSPSDARAAAPRPHTTEPMKLSMLLLLPSLCSALLVSPLAASTQPRVPAAGMQLSTEERIETMIKDNKCVLPTIAHLAAGCWPTAKRRGN